MEIRIEMRQNCILYARPASPRYKEPPRRRQCEGADCRGTSTAHCHVAAQRHAIARIVAVTSPLRAVFERLEPGAPGSFVWRMLAWFA
jgi:hypothetical protein